MFLERNQLGVFCSFLIQSLLGDELPLDDGLEVETQGPLQVVRVVVVQLRIVRIRVDPVSQHLQLEYNTN